MSRWRDLASKMQDEGGRDNRDNGDNSPPQLAIVPNVPIVSVGGPSAWLSALNAVDVRKPVPGLSAERWRQLVDDARWLAEKHGKAALALGWGASDLFGLDPIWDGWGGLADRLEGARTLKLTENLAQWQELENVGWLWRETLTAKPLLWEVPAKQTSDKGNRP